MAAKRSGKVTRRRLLRLGGGAAAVAAVGGAIDAFAVEPLWTKLTAPEIAVGSLPPAWEGVRIAHLTDLHVGPLIGLEYVRKVVAMTNDAAPDLVVHTGDFVSRTDAVDGPLTDALAKLRAPLGAFAVLGNHDHWCDAARLTTALEAAGIVMLTNTRRVLQRHGAPLCLAGVDDLWEGRQLLDAALDGLDESVPRIVLCHNPDYAEQMPAAPRVDLLLCGHTHGGQVKLPLLGRPRLPIEHKKYGAGLVRGPRCAVFVSCGLGMASIPIRFNCRPELPIITLRRA